MEAFWLTNSALLCSLLFIWRLFNFFLQFLFCLVQVRTNVRKGRCLRFCTYKITFVTPRETTMELCFTLLKRFKNVVLQFRSFCYALFYSTDKIEHHFISIIRVTRDHKTPLSKATWKLIRTALLRCLFVPKLHHWSHRFQISCMLVKRCFCFSLRHTVIKSVSDLKI